MSKNTMRAGPDGRPPAKPKLAKPATTKPKLTKAKSEASTKAAGSAPTKAAVKKAAKAVAKAATKAATKSNASAKQAKTDAAQKPAKAAVQLKPRSTNLRTSDRLRTSDKIVSKVQAPAVPSLGQSLQAAVPAAVAVNTKLVDIAQENVSAGLELARDLASAKSPMEAMQLGVDYWFNQIGAVQARARELHSLSAAWVKTASEQTRAG